jgi:predicted esterase
VSLSPGAKLGPYEILSPLGAGGMGEVYKARDTRLGREVAIKVLPAEFSADRDRLRRFEQEARATAALDHPNILAVFDIGTHEGTPYIVEQLLEGESLRQRLRGGPLTPAMAVEFGFQIASGLAAAHEKGIVHRDLKPENLFITKDGRLKILDFGLARLRRRDLAELDRITAAPTEDAPTQMGRVMGTVGYMSPEQAEGRPVDVRSDVFSFGIVLYEMVTGTRPFTGDSDLSILSSILRETPAPVTKVQPAAPARLDPIVTRCLEKKPDDRYGSGAELAADLAALEAEISSKPGGFRGLPAVPRRWLLAAAGLAVILAAAGGIWWYMRDARQRWVRNVALPKLQEIVDHIDSEGEGRGPWDAFQLARQIDAVAPGDPFVERLRPQFTMEFPITSDPPGASVYARYYDEPDGAPLFIGKTPLDRARYPWGITRIQIALKGRGSLEDVIMPTGLSDYSLSYRFPPPGKVPEGMAFVPEEAPQRIYMAALRHIPDEPTGTFAMDRWEVSNRDYQRFVDAGGYADPKYWKQPFLEGGRQLNWKEAMARFTDRTGRPGPATWELGTFPKGQEDYPVAGVCWYEAAAYAEWAGKSLPTLFHWNRVAGIWAGARIIPAANLSGSGPVPTGSRRCASRFGVYDLAGNVREWVVNASGEGAERFILGGGWNDPDYAFLGACAQPAFDRSPTNGFRCIRYLETPPNLSTMERLLREQTRDFKAEKPVSDAVFAQYLRQFVYDKTPLDARIEEEETTEMGLRQRISFNAGYGGERMSAYLFLPSAASPPYQVVVFFPGSDAIVLRTSKDLLDNNPSDFLPRSGRAVMYPIYKGTFWRSDDLASIRPDCTATYRDHVVMWAKDLGRSIDYLETRKDIDASRLAYFGYSWGGLLGAILPAVEKRIKVNILCIAGLTVQFAFPEVDQINYVSRVEQPTLMLNGELDPSYPRESSQRPMFELLGTPPADKRWVLFPNGHSVPRIEMIKESLAWLDRYLGPVEQERRP